MDKRPNTPLDDAFCAMLENLGCKVVDVTPRQPAQQRPENIPNLASGVHYGERI